MSPSVVGSGPPSAADSPPDGHVPEKQVPDDLLTVHVLGLPLAVQLLAQQHGDELTRELTLIAEQLRQQGNTGACPRDWSLSSWADYSEGLPGSVRGA